MGNTFTKYYKIKNKLHKILKFRTYKFDMTNKTKFNNDTTDAYNKIPITRQAEINDQVTIVPEKINFDTTDETKFNKEDDFETKKNKAEILFKKQFIELDKKHLSGHIFNNDTIDAYNKILITRQTEINDQVTIVPEKINFDTTDETKFNKEDDFKTKKYKA